MTDEWTQRAVLPNFELSRILRGQRSQTSIILHRRGWLILILAGSQAQADWWMHCHGIPPALARYISHPDDIRGINSAPLKLVRVGDWESNPLAYTPELTAVLPDWRHSLEFCETPRGSYSIDLIEVRSFNDPYVEQIPVRIQEIREDESRQILHEPGQSSIPEWIAQWCADNHWSEPELIDRRWWAYDGQAVMKTPLPDTVQRRSRNLNSSDLIVRFMSSLRCALESFLIARDIGRIAAHEGAVTGTIEVEASTAFGTVSITLTQDELVFAHQYQDVMGLAIHHAQRLKQELEYRVGIPGGRHDAGPNDFPISYPYQR